MVGAGAGLSASAGYEYGGARFRRLFPDFAAARRYADFLDRTEKARTLFLDLGSGWNTPGVFKVPFWRMTLRRPEARYACVNLEPDQLPTELGDRAVHIASDIGATLARLA